MRTDNVNESVSAAAETFHSDELDRYIMVQKYASCFLDRDEAEVLKRTSRRNYYRCLARAGMTLREDGFWKYHRSGLTTLGEKIDRLTLGRQIGCELLSLALNPGASLGRAAGYAKRGIGWTTTIKSRALSSAPLNQHPIAEKCAPQSGSGEPQFSKNGTV